MKIHPVGSHVLVKVQAQPPEETSPGGLVLPHKLPRAPQIVEVVAIGPGEYRNGALVPNRVEPGERAMMGTNYDSIELMIDGAPHRLIDEGDILAVVED